MKRRTSTLISHLFPAIALVLLAGCTSTRPLDSSDSTTQDVGRISGGIAAIAGESAESENTVTRADADRQPGTSIEQLLQGRVAGVEVVELPGGGFSVRIRGKNSIMGGTEPLYVVDGMQVMHNTRDGLSWLNIKDVEKIEVLKELSATSLYGVRGANGVVLITTKRGAGDN